MGPVKDEQRTYEDNEKVSLVMTKLAQTRFIFNNLKGAWHVYAKEQFGAQ